MIEVFRKRFWYDENNVPKKWSRIEENNIDRSFQKIRNECIEIFDIFKELKLIKQPIKTFNYEKDDNLYNHVMSQIESLLNNPYNKESLYKPEEISVLKRKFDEGIDIILDDAKRRHASIFSNNLPWWGWALILYLGYDDFFRFIGSYWFIPVILILALYGSLYAIGLGAFPRRLIYMVYDKIIKKVMDIFQRG